MCVCSIQRADGSWEGMWGICFTYGIWFAMDGLIEAGVAPDHPAVLKACAFLISKQQVCCAAGTPPREQADVWSSLGLTT